MLYVEKFFNNFQQYKKYFFDYDLILYADIRLKDILHDFSIINNIIIHYLIQKSHSDGMFWRFNPILYSTYDILLIRDIDYTPSEYELSLINDFINLNVIVSIIKTDIINFNVIINFITDFVAYLITRFIRFGFD